MGIAPGIAPVGIAPRWGMAACGGAVAHCGSYGGGCCCEGGAPMPLVIGEQCCWVPVDGAGGMANRGGVCCCCAGIWGAAVCCEGGAHCGPVGCCCEGGALMPLVVGDQCCWAGDRMAPLTMRALGDEPGVGRAPGAGCVSGANAGAPALSGGPARVRRRMINACATL